MVPLKNSRSGYIALLSVLMVGSIAAMAVIILFVTSLNTTLNSSDVDEGAVARALADGCIEVALQSITDQRDIGDSCSPEDTPCQTVWSVTNQGTCSIQALKYIDIGPIGTGSVWRIRTSGSGTMNRLTKFIEVEAYRPDTVNPMTGSAVVIMNWSECVDFSEPITNDCETQ
ncbi:MAG TPA: hypothetical protein VJB82_04730 [Candidatus Peribacterales bacterium]|nr:hypothetical protein [Candidatus Peribacterales bacterium]